MGVTGQLEAHLSVFLQSWLRYPCTQARFRAQSVLPSMESSKR